MPRLTADQWETIRAEREAGESFPELAKRHGVSHQAIQKRAKAEGWSDGQDVAEAVRRKVAEKVAGVVAAENPVKKAAAIDATADRAAEVVRRHQTEPMGPRKLIDQGLQQVTDAKTREQKELAMIDLKAAKLAAEGLAMIQAMERKSFSLDNSPPPSSAPAVVILPSNGR